MKRTSNLKLQVLIVAALSIVLSSCSDLGDTPLESLDETPNAAMTISFQKDIRPLLDNARCSARGACHGSGAGSLTITSTACGDILKGAGDHGPLVVAGDAQASSLYLEVSSAFRFQGQMPIGGRKLTSEQQELIRDWINDGAKNN